jgi:small subunit ribosomal protein S20
MPITKSAKKALRQSVKRKKQNLVKKNALKSIFKEIKKKVEEKEYQEAKNLLPKFYKAVDKAAKVGIVKKNTASRKKSRTVKMVNRAS